MYRDDGSLKMGIYTAIAVIAAFLLGYTLRDRGVIIQFNLNQPTTQEAQPNEHALPPPNTLP
jgi:hypothetical protein